MRRSRLWWFAVLFPVAVLGSIELLADWILDPYLPFPLDTLTVTATALVVSIILVTLAGRRIERLRALLAARTDEIDQRTSTARALHQLGVSVAATRDLDAVLVTVAESSRRLLGAEVAFVLTQSPNATNVPAVAGPTDAIPTRTAPAGVGPGDVLAEAYRASVVAAPIHRGPTTIGALAIAGRQARTLTVDELETLSSLANLLALAIENARLEAQLREVAVRGERERIAREMHDGLAQVLGYVNAKSQAVEELLHRERIGEARTQLAELAAAARSLYVDVREAILGLSSPITPGRGLVGAIEEYATRFADAAKLPTSVEASPAAAAASLSPEREAQAFRIVQEALTNVRKHAAAQRVSIEVALEDAELVVRVADDGRGPPAAAADGDGARWPHYGLTSMRDRAASIGGRLSVDPGSRGGTVVTLRMPRGAPVEALPT